MAVLINLNNSDPHSPKLDLVGDDELKDELALFLNKGMMSLNGFGNPYLAKFIFDSEFGHHRWDFMFKDGRKYNERDWNSLVSLNLAWDCWLIAKDLREM